MLDDNVNFEFIGFDPEYKMRSFIISVADRIQNISPSDSSIKVAIKKGKGAVEASCRVASQAGEFMADVVCGSPLAAIHQIESKIQRQLDEWKKRRFVERAPCQVHKCKSKKGNLGGHMDSYQTDLMYELHVKDLNETDALKQLADHTVKEIKSTTGWDTEVHIAVEPEAKDKRLFAVSMSVFGLHEPVVVRKEGKNILAVFRKVKKTVLRQIHRMNERRITVRKKKFFKEQCAS